MTVHKEPFSKQWVVQGNLVFCFSSNLPSAKLCQICSMLKGFNGVGVRSNLVFCLQLKFAFSQAVSNPYNILPGLVGWGGLSFIQCFALAQTPTSTVRLRVEGCRVKGVRMGQTWEVLTISYQQVFFVLKVFKLKDKIVFFLNRFFY